MKLLLIIPALVLTSCAGVKPVPSYTGGITDKGANKRTTSVTYTTVQVKKTNPKNFYSKQPKTRVRIPGDLTKYNY